MDNSGLDAIGLLFTIPRDWKYVRTEFQEIAEEDTIFKVTIALWGLTYVALPNCVERTKQQLFESLVDLPCKMPQSSCKLKKG